MQVPSLIKVGIQQKMNSVDLITMIGNLSQSLASVDRLVTGVSYLAGLVLVYSGILKFRKVASSGGRSQEHYFNALAFTVAGAILLFFPTSVRIMSSTVFGSENILSYAHFNKWDIFASMGILIKTVGMIWFVRGCIMVVHASSPGHQNGLRGMFFIVTGIFAMNFVWTMAMVNDVVKALLSWSFTFKKA